MTQKNRPTTVTKRYTINEFLETIDSYDNAIESKCSGKADGYFGCTFSFDEDSIRKFKHNVAYNSISGCYAIAQIITEKKLADKYYVLSSEGVSCSDKENIKLDRSFELPKDDEEFVLGRLPHDDDTSDL